MYWREDNLFFFFFFHAFPFVFSHVFSVNNWSTLVYWIFFPSFLNFSLQNLIMFILINNSLCYHPACYLCMVLQNNLWTTIWNSRSATTIRIRTDSLINLPSDWVCTSCSGNMYIVLMGKTPEHYFTCGWNSDTHNKCIKPK